MSPRYHSGGTFVVQIVSAAMGSILVSHGSKDSHPVISRYHCGRAPLERRILKPPPPGVKQYQKSMKTARQPLFAREHRLAPVGVTGSGSSRASITANSAKYSPNCSSAGNPLPVPASARHRTVNRTQPRKALHGPRSISNSGVFSTSQLVYPPPISGAVQPVPASAAMPGFAILPCAVDRLEITT